MHDAKLESFDYIEDNSDEIDVLNASWGVIPSDERANAELYKKRANKLVAEKDIFVVAAAGNEGPDYATIRSPGIAENVLTVGSINKNKEMSSFSSRGPTPDERLVKPEVVAIGENVVAAAPTDSGNKPAYQIMDGTSIAAPMGGVAATHVMSTHPEWSALKIKNAIISTSDPIQTESGFYDVYTQGAGVIQIESAAETNILISDAVVNLGSVYGSDTSTVTIKFNNVCERDQRISLSSFLKYVETSQRYVDAIDTTPHSFTLNPGEKMGVDIIIDPPRDFGIYSGRIFADNRTSDIQHNVILGYTHFPDSTG